MMPVKKPLLALFVPFLVTIPLGACEFLHPTFKELADLTSGLVVLLKDHRETEKLSALMKETLRGNTVITIGSNKQSRKKRNAGGAADSRYSILVDESMEKITVTVSTTRLDTNGLYILALIFQYSRFYLTWKRKLLV